MRKKYVIILVMLAISGIFFAFSVPSSENVLSEREVELVMHFWYIKFDDPSSDARKITWSCCPEYKSLCDGNEIIIKTPYGTFKATFDKDMGLYICGSAAHLFGLPFGQLPRLEIFVGEEATLSQEAR